MTIENCVEISYDLAGFLSYFKEIDEFLKKEYSEFI